MQKMHDTLQARSFGQVYIVEKRGVKVRRRKCGGGFSWICVCVLFSWLARISLKQTLARSLDYPGVQSQERDIEID